MSTALLQCAGCLSMVQANLINYTPIADRLFRLCNACSEDVIKQGKGLQKWLLDKRDPRPAGPVAFMRSFDTSLRPSTKLCTSRGECGECRDPVQCNREEHPGTACQGMCSSCEATTRWTPGGGQ